MGYLLFVGIGGFLFLVYLILWGGSKRSRLEEQIAEDMKEVIRYDKN